MGLGKWTVGNCLLTGTGEECVCAAGLGRSPPEFLHLPFSYPKHKPSFNSATTKLLPSTCLLHLRLTASCCDAVVAILLVLVSCSWSQLPLRTPGPFLVPSPLLLVQYFPPKVDIQPWDDSAWSNGPPSMFPSSITFLKKIGDTDFRIFTSTEIETLLFCRIDSLDILQWWKISTIWPFLQ